MTIQGKIQANWTPEEDELLRRLYPDTDIDEICRTLGRTRRAIYRHAAVIGVKRSAEKLSTIRYKSTKPPKDNKTESLLMQHRFLVGFTELRI